MYQNILSYYRNNSIVSKKNQNFQKLINQRLFVQKVIHKLLYFLIIIFELKAQCVMYQRKKNIITLLKGRYKLFHFLNQL